MADLGSRHAPDGVSLVLGLLLIAVAALFLVADISDGGVDLRWVGPVVLIVIGGAGLAASMRRR